MKDTDSIEGAYPGHIERGEGDHPWISIALSHVDEVKIYFQPYTIIQNLSGLEIEARGVFHDGAYLIHIEAPNLGFNLNSLIGTFAVRHTGSALVNREGLWICLENDVSIRDDIIYINSRQFKVKRIHGPYVILNGENLTISTEEGARTWLLICPIDSMDAIIGKEFGVETVEGQDEASLLGGEQITNPALRLNQKIRQAAVKVMNE